MALVDADRIEQRLAVLRRELTVLDEIRMGGESAYLTDPLVMRATERSLQVAIQACIDLGAHVLLELDLGAAGSYAEVFANLRSAGVLPPDLSERLVEAARMRNRLVHLYVEIDRSAVFAALEHLDDLREFARLVRLRTEG